MSEARFGRFVLIRPVRKGGLGMVSLAWDSEKSRVVALKRARNGDERFTHEIWVTMRLRHANLATPLDSGDVDGNRWLAMEWLEGQDLESLLERARKLDQRLPLPMAGAIVRQVLSALEYLHREGVVHRDVSPRNVMIGWDGSVRLVDYGLALSPEKSTHTRPGAAPGTAGFQAPEQREGKPEPASDLFAAGALLWFALTGAPYVGEGEDGNSKEPLRHRLHAMAGELPPSLVTFLWRALQRRPRQRFDGAGPMGAQLADAVGTPPAPQAALGGWVTQLFPVEQKLATDEIAAVRQRFDVPTAPVVPPKKRRLLVWVAVIAAFLVLVEVAWIAQRKPEARLPPIAAKPIAPPPAVAPPPIVMPPPLVAQAPPPPAAVVEKRRVRPPAPPPVHIEAARTKVGLAELKLREADYSGAIALASEAIQIGGSEDAYLVRAFAELRSGRKADAARDFQHVLARDPNNAAARSGLEMTK